MKNLQKELEQAVSDASEFIVRNASDFETRHCIWPGQDESGRKWAGKDGEDPFPWNGASDTRIRLADEVINDTVRMLLAATKRATIQAGPREANDAETAAAITTYLRYLRDTPMQSNLRAELPLLANWMAGYGVAVLAVTWDEELRVSKRQVTLAEIVAGVALQAQELAAMRQQGREVDDADNREALARLEALQDPAQDSETAKWLAGLFEGLKLAAARRAVKSLREQGDCMVPQYSTGRAQPLWTACRVFRDVFFPANTSELHRAPWVAWRETLTPDELQARVLSRDYDEKAVASALNTEGSSILDAVQIESAEQLLLDDLKGLIEVFTFYHREVDEDGFVALKAAVLCMGVEEPLAEYDADEDYPFIALTRDRTERILIENRSVPQLVQTHQIEIKTQRDFRSDRTSLTILPPVEVPMARANDKLTFGPSTRVPMRRPGEIAFMRMPTLEPDSISLERAVRQDVDSYFGRSTEGVHPVRQQLYAQFDADNWLDALSLAWKRTLKLAMQHAPDEFLRVTSQQPPQDIERDVVMDFNAADFNMDFVLKKLDLIHKGVLAMDTMGVVSRPGLVAWSMRLIDPILASQVVRTEREASNSEIEDETSQVAKISAGVEPEMKEGQNYALRLQVLETTLRKNPRLLQRYEAEEDFRAMVDARIKHFRFQLQQQENAQIGRLGSMPALG